MQLLVFTCALTALLLIAAPVKAEDKEDAKVEHTTVSPISDMALVVPKTEDMKTKPEDSMKTENGATPKAASNNQPHTIADFIIHPLIALKPRVSEVEMGKQADVASTTASPWQLFGFNPGQGLGSSVQNLAGSVSGWLGNRIQLPGLVDSPVRESTSTSTTTTTERPDVVVRIQQQRRSTRRPLIEINNNNKRRRGNKRPNRYNNNNIDDSEEFYDSEEYDDEEDDDHQYNGNRRRYQNYNDEEDDEEDDDSNHHDEEDVEEDDEEYDDSNHDDESDDEEEEAKPVKQNNRRRRPKPLNHNRRFSSNSQRRKQEVDHQEESEEVEYDDEDESGEEESNYQNSKRSQTEQNFIQRGQQSLMNQIRQLTRGQTPTEVGSTLRKKGNKKRKQATLVINRNGQTVYVAPELLQVADGDNSIISSLSPKRVSSQYPQPPLTTPYRRKGQPTQYITIPWSQLGISPPDQITSLTEGLQTQPLILNIPQSAIDSMQGYRPNKKRPIITSEAVPLLAEASIMDIFKPPRIPPARTPASTSTTAIPTKKIAYTNTPVVIAKKTKGGPTRIRPATVVEMSPAEEEEVMNNEQESSTDAMDDSSETEGTQFIVIGNDSGESHLSRGAYRQILDYFNQQRGGRQLNVEEVPADASSKTQEQLIPVQVITGEEPVPAKVDDAIEAKVETATESSVIEISKEEPKEKESEPIKESSVSV